MKKTINYFASAMLLSTLIAGPAAAIIPSDILNADIHEAAHASSSDIIFKAGSTDLQGFSADAAEQDSAINQEQSGKQI